MPCGRARRRSLRTSMAYRTVWWSLFTRRKTRLSAIACVGFESAKTRRRLAATSVFSAYCFLLILSTTCVGGIFTPLLCFDFQVFSPFRHLRPYNHLSSFQPASHQGACWEPRCRRTLADAEENRESRRPGRGNHGFPHCRAPGQRRSELSAAGHCFCGDRAICRT